MDMEAYLDTRRRRYMAQTLEAFETIVQPHLPPGTENDTDRFKAIVRSKFNAFAVDAQEPLLGGEMNAFAVQARDHAFPHGRSKTTTRGN